MLFFPQFACGMVWGPQYSHPKDHLGGWLQQLVEAKPTTANWVGKLGRRSGNFEDYDYGGQGAFFILGGFFVEFLSKLRLF